MLEMENLLGERGIYDILIISLTWDNLNGYKVGCRTIATKDPKESKLWLAAELHESIHTLSFLPFRT